MNKSKDYPDPNALDENNVVSSTECTGLVQGLPLDEESMEAYSEIYGMPEDNKTN